MIYDVIIVWAGAAGLFSGICLNKNLKKLILEKTAKPWTKVLMSGWERANVSNADIEPTRDYFTQNKKFLFSIFSNYTNWDTMSFFAENWVEIVEEDRNRLILKSWDSKELLTCLLKNIQKSNCELKINQDIKNISKNKDLLFEIVNSSEEKYFSKNVIIASWWKSFPQVWTTGEGYNIAKSFWIEVVNPYRTLCGMATKRDLSEISWVSVDLQLQLFDRKNEKKAIYSENWPLLFTHFWVSWPIVHNLSNAIWEYLNLLKIDEIDFEKYILENLFLSLNFDLEKTPKRILKFFELSSEKNLINLDLQNWRSWKEAKATWWGISTNELDNHMQAKKVSWLYFIWEVVDVTGKTWGFNLQWAWSSAFVASKNINEKFIK